MADYIDTFKRSVLFIQAAEGMESLCLHGGHARHGAEYKK